MPREIELTLSKSIRNFVNYDAETGLITWLPRGREHFQSDRSHTVWNARYAMKEAGFDHAKGYRCITILGEGLKAHRVAWMWMTGEVPQGEVDHRNGVKADNRWANLRDVTKSVNQQNQRKPRGDSSTGYLGVSFDKTCAKFTAQIVVNRVLKKIGRFDCPVAAHQAYLEAKRVLHAGCTI